jgi:hypothetical protein
MFPRWKWRDSTALQASKRNTHEDFSTAIRRGCLGGFERIRPACVQWQAAATVHSGRHEPILQRQPGSVQGVQGTCQGRHPASAASVIDRARQETGTLRVSELEQHQQGRSRSGLCRQASGEGRAGLRPAMCGAVLDFRRQEQGRSADCAGRMGQMLEPLPLLPASAVWLDVRPAADLVSFRDAGTSMAGNGWRSNCGRRG